MKRCLAMISCILFLLTVLPLGICAAEQRSGLESQRMTLEGVSHPVGGYAAEKRLEKVPLTIEAWVYLPQSMYEKEAGVVIGNFATQKKDNFTFSIQVAGVPKVSISHWLGKREYTFSSAAIPADTWTHVAMVCLEEKLVCYLNGKYATETMPELWYAMPETALQDALCLAGDRRELNHKGYRGILGDVTLYADIRTPEELQWDAANDPDLHDPNLLAHYDLDGVEFGQPIADASGHGYDMAYHRQWLTEEELAQLRKNDDKEYPYTIAFLPDIQHTTEEHPQRLKPVFDYLLQNREQKNIAYLVSVGDLTHSNTETEWKAVAAQIRRLDGILPYSLVRGNHDGFGRDKTAHFDQYFSKKSSLYYQQVTTSGGAYSEKSVQNTYRLFTMGQVDYLLLNLDFGAKDAVLQWADGVLRQYSNRRVIVVTHGYLHTDGNRLVGGQTYSPSGYNLTLNDGDDLWEKLLRKHGNICMVVSGHITHDHIVHSTATGDQGNTVHQLLLDTQYTDKLLKGAGFLSLMEFTEDGRYARVMHYSTVHNLYFQETAANLVMDLGQWTPEGETPQEETPAAESLTGLLELVTNSAGEYGWLLAVAMLLVAGVVLLLLCLRKRKR